MLLAFVYLGFPDTAVNCKDKHTHTKRLFIKIFSEVKSKPKTCSGNSIILEK